MITLDSYKSMLSQKGDNVGSVHKNRSNDLMNIMFKNDVGYKKVYILTQNKGWQYYDARYSKHSTPSISKDHVDYYLQFRPNITFPIGTYLFIPDEISDDIGFIEESPVYPFKDEGFNINKLWMIVGRDLNNQFTRYMILQCNWNFKWVDNTGYENIIVNCYGALRSASSYTSGVWVADYLTTLDQITGAWMPNLKYIYGDKLSEYGLYDNERINYGERFVISTNPIYPKVYTVTKVIDLNPLGLLKITFTQDEFNESTDSAEYMVCDYYNLDGKVIPENTDVLDTGDSDELGISYVYWKFVNDDGELIDNDGSYTEELVVGKTSYFEVEFIDAPDTISAQWTLTFNNTNNQYTDDEAAYYENLIILKKIDDNLLSVRPSKANSLKGKEFTLTVTDLQGNYESSIELEVSE